MEELTSSSRTSKFYLLQIAINDFIQSQDPLSIASARLPPKYPPSFPNSTVSQGPDIIQPVSTSGTTGPPTGGNQWYYSNPRSPLNSLSPATPHLASKLSPFNRVPRPRYYSTGLHKCNHMAPTRRKSKEHGWRRKSAAPRGFHHTSSPSKIPKLQSQCVGHPTKVCTCKINTHFSCWK